jgi:hypothetical protein
VTAQGGVITAVGIGTATVTVSYAGLSRAVMVIARRLMRLTGAVTVEDALRWFSIHAVKSSLDSRVVYGESFSGGMREFTIPLGQPEWPDTSVEPGQVRLSVLVSPTSSADHVWTSRADAYVEIRDRETDEVLARLPLAPQSVNAAQGTNGEFVWTLTIAEYH